MIENTLIHAFHCLADSFQLGYGDLTSERENQYAEVHAVIRTDEASTESDCRPHMAIRTCKFSLKGCNVAGTLYMR